jgi:hypothetical protein
MIEREQSAFSKMPQNLTIFIVIIQIDIDLHIDSD